MIKCLLTELGRAVRENILLWVICTASPQAKYFPVRPSHSVNKYISFHNACQSWNGLLPDDNIYCYIVIYTYMYIKWELKNHKIICSNIECKACEIVIQNKVLLLSVELGWLFTRLTVLPNSTRMVIFLQGNYFNQCLILCF